MQTRLRTICVLVSATAVLGSLAARQSPAQEFSADVVEVPASGTSTTRLYVANSKLRFQTQESGQPAGGAIIDADQKTTTIVDDKDHTYFGGSDSPLLNTAMNASGLPALWRFFRPANAADPCTDWNAALQPYAHLDSTQTPPQFSCQGMGADVVNGRSAQKWQVTATQGAESKTGYAWIDTRLHVVSKSQDQSSEMELRNIQEGPQSDSVFQVPAGYRKADLSALMLQLKGASGANSSAGGVLGAVGTSAKNGAIEGTKEGASEAAREKAKEKVKKLFHVP